MKKSSIIILQDCLSTAEEIANRLKDDFDIKYVGVDGNEGWQSIQGSDVDIALISLVLKGIDGYEVMRRIKSEFPKIKILVLSNFFDDYNIRNSIEAGASYYMVKPVDYDALKSRMAALCGDESKSRLREDGKAEMGYSYSERNVDRTRNLLLDEKISKIFISVGIPPHIKGYSYLREGIRLAVNDPDIINNITKKLYPTIGQKYGTTSSKVERAIRHAIEVAWNKGRIENFNAIFGVRTYSDAEKPTNSEFIALIADRMLLDGVG